MEQADHGLELGKGAGRGKGGFRDQKWRGRFLTNADRSRASVLLPNNNDKRAWNSQVEHKAQSDNPLKRQRRTGNSSSFIPSGKKLCGAFNSAKGCLDERYCPQKALHRCNIITSTDGRVCFATDDGGHQHRSQETCFHTPMGWERPQEILPSSPLSMIEGVGLSSTVPNILRGLVKAANPWTLSSAERLAVCGFLVTALDEVSQSDRGQVEVRRNTLIGRGFHLPSIIPLFTIMALEVLGASTDLSYGPAELFLVRRVHGTVFQPGAFYSFPGLITA